MEEFYKNKKILITGHTGFKGSWLTKILLMKGAKIIGYALKPKTDPSLFYLLNLDKEKKITNYYGDIFDYENLNKIVNKEKPEIIFHLAAQPLVRDSYDDPLYTYRTNIIGSANILETVKDCNSVKSVVMITTDKVYENKEWVYAYRENDKLGGYDPYSSSKACVELIISSYRNSFFNLNKYEKTHNTLIASCRGGNVIGGGDWSKDRIIPDIIRSILINNEMLEIRSPNAIRPWQHVLELLNGYLIIGKLLYEGNKKIAQSWNFGPNSNNFKTVKDLVEGGFKVLKKGEYILKDLGNKHEANLLKLDIEKSRSILNWNPTLSFDETIEWTFEWYDKYYKQENIINFTEKQIINFFRIINKNGK